MSKRTKYLLGIGVIAALVIGWQVAAFAVHDEGVFELDGNANNQAAAGDDWSNIFTPPNGATATAFINEEPAGSQSIFTGGGSKDPIDLPSWKWKNGGGLPDKDNLLHAYAARYTSGTDQLLYFGSDRFDNSGDAVQGFWFFQQQVNNEPNGTFSGVHEDGDLLILSDFSNGGGTATIAVYEWMAACNKAGDVVNGKTCGDDNLLTLASSNSAKCPVGNPIPPLTDDRFCGIVNPNTITMPWTFNDKTPNNGTNTAINGEFYEGGVNLTALGLADRCFSSVAAESRSSTSTTAVLKDFVVGAFGDCNATVETDESTDGEASIGDGTVDVTDDVTVTVNGAASWSGEVQFSLTGPIGETNETTVDIGDPIPVDQGTSFPLTSDTATVTSAGDYCWSASFDAQTPADLGDAVDDGTNECFTVTPVEAALTTQAVASPVDFGQPVQDNATLTGTATQPDDPVINTTGDAGPAADGTITFTLYKDDCTTLATSNDPNEDNPQSVTVSGDSPPDYGPVSFTPDEPGTYHWVASYDPDAVQDDPNNDPTDHNLDCTEDNEEVVVSQRPSSVATEQSFIPNDEATITAGPDGTALGTGTVDFELFGSLADCQDPNATSLYAETANLGANSVSPATVSTTNTGGANGYTVDAEGDTTLFWRVTYSGNGGSVAGSSSACVEDSTVTIDNTTAPPTP